MGRFHHKELNQLIYDQFALTNLIFDGGSMGDTLIHI
jgi:hypothetical protein